MNGQEIRVARERLALTQEKLGEHFGVTRNTIARWERGELIPKWPKLLRLAFRALEMEMVARSPQLLQAEQEGLQRAATNRRQTDALMRAVT